MKRHKENASRQENWAKIIPFTAFRSALQRTGNAIGVHNVARVIPLHEKACFTTINRKEGEEKKERKGKMEKRGEERRRAIYARVRTFSLFILNEPNEEGNIAPLLLSTASPQTSLLSELRLLQSIISPKKRPPCTIELKNSVVN